MGLEVMIACKYAEGRKHQFLVEGVGAWQRVIMASVHPYFYSRWVEINETEGEVWKLRYYLLS
jgi:hypothetical protein